MANSDRPSQFLLITQTHMSNLVVVSFAVLNQFRDQYTCTHTRKCSWIQEQNEMKKIKQIHIEGIINASTTFALIQTHIYDAYNVS